MSQNTNGVPLSSYRRKAEAHELAGFDSWSDLRDHLPGVLAPHKALVWRTLVHGEMGAAQCLHEILLERRWSVVLQDGTGNNDKVCVMRRAGRQEQADSRGHSSAVKAYFVCILKALEMEAEDAFVGA